MSDFKQRMQEKQIRWRRKSILNQEPGRQNSGYYDHVLPYAEWQQNLWPKLVGEVEGSLAIYLESERIRKHSGVHNLLSSWILCANLYFPFRNEIGYRLLTGFLRNSISKDIKGVSRIELEHAFNEDRLKPSALLGEVDGGRGAGQTSPDVAFEVETNTGRGIILVECKFTEHSFYPCSGRKGQPSGHPPNPDKSRCLDFIRMLDDPAEWCHLVSWQRRYWEHLAPIVDYSHASKLKCCPAAFGGYQLVRQQALAEALASSDDFALVISVVAYDERNKGLMSCMGRSTGIIDVATNWNKMFRGKSGFSTFTHQSWVKWVADQDDRRLWGDWLAYIEDRYSFEK